MPVPTSSNYEKFQTGNPVVRRLIDRFYDDLLNVVKPLGARSLLDAGCGEGETLARLGAALPARAAAIDVSAEAVEFASGRLPEVEVSCQSVLDLAFEDRSFDLILCLEVLEHVAGPEAALDELQRVTVEHLVVSVPDEPWFRAGSLLRGKYVGNLGNHPEHVNHWSSRSFRAFLEPRLEVVSLRRAFPWLIAHCRRRPSRR